MSCVWSDSKGGCDKAARMVEAPFRSRSSATFATFVQGGCSTCRKAQDPRGGDTDSKNMAWHQGERGI